MVTRQLQVERRTGKVRRSKTNVLPLYHATDATNNYPVADGTEYRDEMVAEVWLEKFSMHA